MKSANYWEKSLGKRSLVIGIFILIIIIILSFFVEFIQLTGQNVNTDTEVSLSEYTAHTINTIHNKIEDNFATLEAIASFVGKHENIADSDVMSILHQQSQKIKFTRMAVTTPDGTSYTDDGATHDTADRDYFIKAMHGENFITNVMESRVDGSRVIVLAVPIYKDNQVVGVLRCTFNLEMFENLLKVQTFKGDGASYIIQTDGTLITKLNGFDQIDNYYTFLQDATMQNGNNLQNFQDDIQNGRSGVLRYSYVGKSYYANYVPIGINHWYVLSVVPLEVIQAKTNGISKMVLVLVAKEFAVLMVLFLFIMYLERRQISHIFESNQKLEMLTANIPGGVFRYTADEKEIMHFVSDGLLRLFGYTEKEFRSIIGNKFPNMIYEEDKERVLESIKQQQKESLVYQVEYRIVSAWGDIKWVMHRGQMVTDPKGVKWYYALITDITETKRTQEELRLNEERYRIVAESSSSIIFECDARDGTVTFLSKVTEKYGYKKTIGNYPRGFIDENIIHEGDIDEFYAYCNAITKGDVKGSIEVRCRLKDGSYHWCTLQIMPILDDEHVLIKEIGRITDIDNTRRETEMLREQSKRDPLTGLYNKSQTEMLIDNYLKKEGFNKNHAFLIIDIDNFKAVNDNLGHLFGDSVLKGISSRVRDLFYVSDIAGRVGGDEFVVLLKDAGTKDIILKKAEAICDIFKNAYTGDHKEYKISGSIGISLYNKDGLNYYELFEKADCALYYAKKMGKDRYEFYRNDMNE